MENLCCPNCKQSFDKSEIIVADTEISNLNSLNYDSSVELVLTCSNCEKPIIVKLYVSEIKVVS